VCILHTLCNYLIYIFFQATVEAVCRRDATLLTADVALNFCLEKLNELASPISQELASALSRRAKERRTEFAGILAYLHYGTYALETMDPIFSVPKKTQMANLIKTFLSRVNLDPNDQLDQSEEPEVQIMEDAEGEPRQKKRKSKSAMELNEAIKKMQTPSKPTIQTKDVLGFIKREMALFEGGGSRGYYLQQTYDALKVISPTTVESERAFSSAGYLCNKVRSSMNDNTLDSLCFLRSHFQISD
jgi:hypothetical protein